MLILNPSCNWQNLASTSTDSERLPSIIPSEQAKRLGTTVSKMGKKVMVIFQDKKNNFWFGGNDKGVYKYDGKSLVLFTKKDGLCNNSVLGIQEDKFGNIYFDTSTGVSKFDGQKFTTLDIIDNKHSKSKWKLTADDLWFRMGGGKNGPYRYDGKLLYYLEFPKTNQVEAFYSTYPNASYSPYGIYTIYKDSQGFIWFGTASLGLCRYDGQSINWYYEKQLTETPSGGDFGIRSIIEDKEGYFWFCNTRYRYEILSNTIEENGTNYINYEKEDGIGYSNGGSKIDFPYFMSMTTDNNGDLWMVTYNDGVYQNNGERLIHYPIKNGDTDVLLFSIYKDNQGVLWLGTHNASVLKFNGKIFEPFSPF